MIKLKIFMSSVVLILALVSCTEESSTNPPSGTTLINTSFESNGRFTASGWTLPILSDSSTDAPPNGGAFSLLIESTQPPELYAETKVLALEDYNRFALTFWSKSSGVTNGIFGKAILTLLRNGTEIKSVELSLDNISWESHSISDTFTVAIGDSFRVRLSGGMSQLFSGETKFDLCRLEAIE